MFDIRVDSVYLAQASFSAFFVGSRSRSFRIDVLRVYCHRLVLASSLLSRSERSGLPQNNEQEAESRYPVKQGDRGARLWFVSMSASAGAGANSSSPSASAKPLARVSSAVSANSNSRGNSCAGSCAAAVRQLDRCRCRVAAAAVGLQIERRVNSSAICRPVADSSFAEAFGVLTAIAGRVGG